MGIEGLDHIKANLDYTPLKGGEKMGWKHRYAGLTADGTLYVSEKVKKEDADRAEAEANKSKQAERALEERVRTLGRKIG